MSAYRFCRTDDIPLLVEAWNRCGLPHFPDHGPLTVQEFKQEIRELDLWCSSCMVAFDAKEPVGVLIGCKRPPRTLVHRLAVHPDHLRKGHGRHMLTSLSAKLAILGPPVLVAEIDAGNAPARALFRACGWREMWSYVDLVAASPAAAAAPPGVVVPVTVDEIAEIALPNADAPRSWSRSRGTLLNRKEALQGLAIATGDRLDACVLYSRNESDVTVWSVSSSSPDALGILLRDLAHRERASITIPRVGPDEASRELLSELGFSAGIEWVGVESEARAA